MNSSRNAIWAVADQGVLSATRFLITYLIAHYAMPGELGMYSLGFSVLIFLTTMQESLITVPYQFFVPRIPAAEESSYTGNMLIVSVALSLFGVAVLLIGVPIISALGISTDLRFVIYAVACCLPFHLVREFVRRWQFVHGKIRMVAILDTIFAVLQVLGLFLLLQFKVLTANFAIGVTGLTSLLFCFMAFSQFGSQIDRASNRLVADAKRNFRYGSWIAFCGLCSVVQTYFANWYLAKITLHDADIYTVCMTMAMLANPFLLGISSMHGPQASRAYVEGGVSGVVATVLKNLALIGSILGLYSACLGLFGEWMATLIFGDAYAGQRWPVLVLSLALLGQGVNYIVSNGLCAVNFPHLDLAAAVIGLVSSIAISLLLPPTILNASLGFLGGVVAMAIFRLLALLWIDLKSRRTV